MDEEARQRAAYLEAVAEVDELSSHPQVIAYKEAVQRRDALALDLERREWVATFVARSNAEATRAAARARRDASPTQYAESLTVGDTVRGEVVLDVAHAFPGKHGKAKISVKTESGFKVFSHTDAVEP